jgi:hypothetical protein
MDSSRATGRQQSSHRADRTITAPRAPRPSSAATVGSIPSYSVAVSQNDDDGPLRPEEDLDRTKVQEFEKTAGDLSVSRTVNLELLAQSLQRQATLECKLGKKYYKS